MLFLLPFSGIGQEAKEVLKKMNEQCLKAKRISYNCQYELFKGHASNDIVEQYGGSFYKDQNNIYQKINQTELIYTGEFSLKINHEEKLISIEKPQKTAQQQVDLEAALKECSELKLTDNESYYTVTLLFKQTSSVDLAVLKLNIDKRKYNLMRMDLYYASQMNFSDDYSKPDYAQPHLRITYNDMNHNPSRKNEKFELKQYLIQNNKKYEPSEQYAGFGIINNKTKEQ